MDAMRTLSLYQQPEGAKTADLEDEAARLLDTIRLLHKRRDRIVAELVQRQREPNDGRGLLRMGEVPNGL